MVSLFVLEALYLKGEEKIGGRVRRNDFGFDRVTLFIYIDCKDMSTHHLQR
jgi:hypothetical protein